MEIYKPIFIIGVPRSGTTLLYNIMSNHSELAWFSQNDISNLYTDDFLRFYKLRKRLFDIRNLPSKHRLIPNYDVIFDIPIEFSSFWNHFIGYAWADENHVNEFTKKNLQQTISKITEEKKKKRFLSKYPRNAVRIRYLNKIFPDALFVNIIRDGRAVVASMINRAKHQKDSYFGIPLKKEDQMSYDMLERHARQWVEVSEEINNSRNNLKPEQFYALKYEDFVSNPKIWLKKIFDFCGLEQQDVFQHKIKRIIRRRTTEVITEKLTNRNESWKDQFSDQEINRLNIIMKSLLKKFEYL